MSVADKINALKVKLQGDWFETEFAGAKDALIDVLTDIAGEAETIPAWNSVSEAPASASAKGTAGQYFIDGTGGYLYVCVATDTWMRCEIATWS